MAGMGVVRCYVGRVSSAVVERGLQEKQCPWSMSETATKFGCFHDQVLEANTWVAVGC
jgi:hypothetical protein